MVKNILFDDTDDDKPVLFDEDSTLEVSSNIVIDDETKFEIEKLLINKLGDKVQVDVIGDSIKIIEKPDTTTQEVNKISTEQTVDLVHSTVLHLVKEIHDLKQLVLSLHVDNENYKQMLVNHGTLIVELQTDIIKLKNLYSNTTKKPLISNFFK